MDLRLHARGLTKSFKGRKVVQGVSLSVSQGEIVGLLGPNGAGKTTTFYMIVGLITPDGGSLSIGGRELADLEMYRRARLGLGYLPQEASIFRGLTVEENLLLVLEEMGRPPAKRREVADQLIEDFGLKKIADVPGYALSGGERRRVRPCLPFPEQHGLHAQQPDPALGHRRG